MGGGEDLYIWKNRIICRTVNTNHNNKYMYYIEYVVEKTKIIFNAYHTLPFIFAETTKIRDEYLYSLIIYDGISAIKLPILQNEIDIDIETTLMERNKTNEYHDNQKKLIHHNKEIINARMADDFISLSCMLGGV